MLVNLKEILQIAEERKIAIGMFNATGLESIQAIVDAAVELNMPVIIAHAEVHNIYNDIEIIASVVLPLAKKVSIPICLHLDHGTSLEMIKRAIELGFTSVMYDGSHLPLGENIKNTKKVVEMAHKFNISVEGEVGRLVSGEAGDASKLDNNLSPSDYHTRLDEAIKFVDETNVDALAIAFGTNHGFYIETPKLDFNVIKTIKDAVQIPLVMHGGSGISKEDIHRSIDLGIRKINYYSYMSKAGYDEAKKIIFENKTNYYHDIAWNARKAMKQNVLDAIQVFSKKEL